MTIEQQNEQSLHVQVEKGTEVDGRPDRHQKHQASEQGQCLGGSAGCRPRASPPPKETVDGEGRSSMRGLPGSFLPGLLGDLRDIPRRCRLATSWRCPGRPCFTTDPAETATALSPIFTPKRTMDPVAMVTPFPMTVFSPARSFSSRYG